MKNFSEINLKTTKEQAIDLACSSTGLSDVIVGKLYESQKMLGKLDDEIIDYLTSMNTEQHKYTSVEFIEEISKIVAELSLNDGVDGNKHKFTQNFLQILTDFDNEGKIDSVNLLDVINQILIIKNPKIKNNLTSIMQLKFDETKILNENFNSSINLDDNINSVLLFEGLKEILSKNNKRFGVSYHIQNSYNAIMNYIDTEIKEIELSKKIYSIDNKYHIIILNEMLSGTPSPLYLHVNNVKSLVSDIQTLVFDMMLLVNRYFSVHDSSLEFVKRSTYNDYKKSSSDVVGLLLSSVKNSHLILDCDKKVLFKEIEISDDNIMYSYQEHKTIKLIDKFSQLIANDIVSYNTWNISLKSVVDMLNFIKSSTGEFNLKIRPSLRTYITKGYELAASVEKADLALKKISRY